MQEASIGDNAKAQLRSIVERVENLNDQIDGLRSDQKDIFQEAKGVGFDVRAIRKIISMRKQDPEDRARQEQVLETYMLAMDMI